MIKYILIAVIVLNLASCSIFRSTKNEVQQNETIEISNEKSDFLAEMSFIKGKSFNNPTFVVWLEDLNGNYIKTIYITKSYASATFKHAALSDTTWSDKAGQSIKPSALPYWTHKKGKLKDGNLVPTQASPFVDAFSGATPKSNFTIKSNIGNNNEMFNLLVEVNQTWDWNEFWTNAKYPESKNYKYSAQPSLIYSARISKEEAEIYLNPVGHGDAKGETGKLFTDISTLTSAKEIFEKIIVRIQK
ncbi:MAG TPA: hypothetical protein DDX39_10635 [Bacteroidales bacterium]|nr:MAG: hypothetical protein A2W98_00835 [Bacteroidetes bacterium GWF2_33_38]OFY89962.1 MAG: hypothetical protein A2236_09865 [Bacteroidetes bacterium RIFOXYA2_FULL_33_7]HBF89087.1 hypothetical protein [Bacteroidales bacterium]